MWMLYNALFAVLFAVALPKYLLRMLRRGGYRKGFMQRLGVYGREVPSGAGAEGRLWFHAVSVGEIYVAMRFMKEIRARQPGAGFVLTTNTSTAHRIAEKDLPPGDILVYTPVDFPFAVKRFLRRFRPAGLLLVECELWPNMIRIAAAAGVPVALLNGRVSDSSYRGYRLLRAVFRPVLRRIRVFLVQGEEERRRLTDLGAEPDRIVVTGSAKYDGVGRDPDAEARLGRLLARCGMGAGSRLLVAGSTWPGEEAAMLRVLAGLRRKIPELKLVIVPRHAERADEVANEITRAGFAFFRRSGLDHDRAADGAAPDVLLVDTTGELRHYYPFAEAVFVGKSLTSHGGQNIVEACFSGRPVVVGPHMENFPVIVRDFLDAGAIVQVRDEPGLAAEMEKLLESPGLAGSVGRNAVEVIRKRAGTVARGVDELSARIRQIAGNQLRNQG